MFEVKTIVITGSTSGIGKELLDLYAKSNAKLLIFAGYRREELLGDYSFSNSEIIPFFIDLNDRLSIVEATKFIKSKTDHIDVVFNIAGRVVAGPIEQIDTCRLREQFDVNVFSHIEFVQNLVEILDNSRIVNVSSVASFGHFPFISPYCASKRALDIFFNAFQIENHKNIKVISIKPGVIATPLWEKSIQQNQDSLSNCIGYEKEMEFMKINAQKNSSRGLKVEEVAKFIKNIVQKSNPKVSYTIGLDSKAGEILSYLPQHIVNKMIKFALRYRINK